MIHPRSSPIGVFDSGVGGLSVLRSIHDFLPSENLIFVADQAHAPYGPRPHEELRAFSEGITRFLLAQNCKLIVVACNSASAAALKHLRETFGHPGIPVVGMEPAVKPATERTRSKAIGVLATSATFKGNLYRRLLEKFATGTRVMESACPGLVQAIERAEFDSPATLEILESAIDPMLEAGADTLVLGCTHYPFIKALIERRYPGVFQIIDPAPSVARFAKQLLSESGLLRDAASSPELTLLTSGDLKKFEAVVPSLIGKLTDRARFESIYWTETLEVAAGSTGTSSSRP